MMIHAGAVVGAGLIAMTTVAAVATAVAAAIEGTAAVTTIAIADHRDTKIEITAHTDVVTIMGPAASIAMPRAAAMTVTAAVGRSVAVVEAMIGNVPAMVATAMQRLLGMLAMRMEVEPPTVQTIGTPVVELRSAKIHRCGALSEIDAPEPTSTRARKAAGSQAGSPVTSSSASTFSLHQSAMLFHFLFGGRPAERLLFYQKYRSFPVQGQFMD
jgi:hypothetical protein